MTLDQFVKVVTDMRKVQKMLSRDKKNEYLMVQAMKLEEQCDQALKSGIKTPLNTQKTLFES